jgi:hypothetical protein
MSREFHFVSHHSKVSFDLHEAQIELNKFQEHIHSHCHIHTNSKITQNMVLITVFNFHFKRCSIFY